MYTYVYSFVSPSSFEIEDALFLCTFVGVGFTNGVVRVLDSVSLEDCCTPFHHSKDCVTHIVFSHDSMYIATAVCHMMTLVLKGLIFSCSCTQDLDRCVTVFEASGGENEEEEEAWKYLGHYRSHFKHITGVVV